MAKNVFEKLVQRSVLVVALPLLVVGAGAIYYVSTSPSDKTKSGRPNGPNAPELRQEHRLRPDAIMLESKPFTITTKEMRQGTMQVRFEAVEVAVNTSIRASMRDDLLNSNASYCGSAVSMTNSAEALSKPQPNEITALLAQCIERQIALGGDQRFSVSGLSYTLTLQ